MSSKRKGAHPKRLKIVLPRLGEKGDPKMSSTKLQEAKKGKRQYFHVM